jgi:hypothetical protein
LGRWIYDEVWPVNKDPFEGEIRVAYELLEPVTSGKDPLSIAQAWIRLVIWRPMGSQGLKHETPHVNVASNLDDLIQANLQPDPGGLSLYLTDYRTIPPTFETQPGTEPWKQTILKPARLVEVHEAMRGVHPEDRTKVETKAERARRLGGP